MDRASDCRVSVVARSNYEAVKANGLRLKTLDHGEQVVKPHGVFKTPAEAKGKYDFVVCANKALDPTGLPETLTDVITPGHTAIVIIQNGVGAEEPFKEKYPENSVITCVSWTGAGQEAPGLVVQSAADYLTMGSYPGGTEKDKKAIEEFATLMEQGGGKYEIVEEILRKRWEKVVWNACWNSITAMTSYDVHNIVHSSKEAEPVLRRLMDEVIKVAQAQGINVSSNLTDELFETAMSRKVSFGSSMKMDVDAGRRSEVEVILGHAVRMGQKYNVDTPTLNLAYVAVKAIDHKFATQKL